jgi:hypothetical protein
VEFLIDADLPFSLERVLVEYGHRAIHVGNVGYGWRD